MLILLDASSLLFVHKQTLANSTDKFRIGHIQLLTSCTFIYGFSLLSFLYPFSFLLIRATNGSMHEGEASPNSIFVSVLFTDTQNTK